MAHVISFHSFRSGTGKSNLAANLTALLVKSGKRVCLVDADLQSPTASILFNHDDSSGPYLNDYLAGNCTIRETAVDLSARIDSRPAGSLTLVPADPTPTEIVRGLREGHNFSRLVAGINSLSTAFTPDLILIDTHGGLSEITLNVLAASDQALLLLRADQQDYQGTSVLLDLAYQLEVRNLLMVVNQLPSIYRPEPSRRTLALAFEGQAGITGRQIVVIPYSEDVMAYGSRGVFALEYPRHAFTRQLARLTGKLVPPGTGPI